MKKILIILLGVLFISSVAVADYKSDLENGLNAYRTGDYPKAYRYLKAAYAQKPSDILSGYLKQAEEKYRGSMDSLLDEAGVDDSYGGWAAEENMIAINPCFIYYGTLFLYYERKITNILSFGVGGGYSPTGGAFGGRISNAAGHVVGGIINLFPEGRALNGWFVGPEFFYHDFKYDVVYDDYYTPAELISIRQFFVTYGMHGGYRWILPSGFTVDLSAGMIMRTGKTISSDPDYYTDYYYAASYTNYFSPTLGCNVGLAF